MSQTDVDSRTPTATSPNNQADYAAVGTTSTSDTHTIITTGVQQRSHDTRATRSMDIAVLPLPVNPQCPPHTGVPPQLSSASVDDFRFPEIDLWNAAGDGLASSGNSLPSAPIGTYSGSHVPRPPFVDSAVPLSFPRVVPSPAPIGDTTSNQADHVNPPPFLASESSATVSIVRSAPNVGSTAVASLGVFNTDVNGDGPRRTSSPISHPAGTSARTPLYPTYSLTHPPVNAEGIHPPNTQIHHHHRDEGLVTQRAQGLAYSSSSDDEGFAISGRNVSSEGVASGRAPSLASGRGVELGEDPAMDGATNSSSEKATIDNCPKPTHGTSDSLGIGSAISRVDGPKSTLTDPVNASSQALATGRATEHANGSYRHSTVVSWDFSGGESMARPQGGDAEGFADGCETADAVGPERSPAASLFSDAQPWDTPVRDRHDALSKDDGVVVDAEDDLKAVGRISDANLTLINHAFDEILTKAKSIAARTGLSTSQVFDQWTTMQNRKHVKKNLWNLYGAYFKDNEKQELARIADSEFRTFAHHP